MDKINLKSVKPKLYSVFNTFSEMDLIHCKVGKGAIVTHTAKLPGYPHPKTRKQANRHGMIILTEKLNVIALPLEL